MVDRNIITKLGLSPETIDQEVNELFSNEHNQMLSDALEKKEEA